MYMVSEECFVSPQINAVPQCGHARVAGAILHKNAINLKKTFMPPKVIFFCYLKLNETMLWLNKVKAFIFGVVLLKVIHILIVYTWFLVSHSR